jgi:D-glycero-D-manno-heptose 1,7-bisphosphate phosphatase
MAEPDQVELLPGVLPLISYLNERAFSIVVVSNQSGIQRGLVTPEQALAVHQRFCDLLGKAGADITAVLYCPHSPSENCQCRKPNPGLLLQAAEQFQIALTDSFMVGDKISDCEAGLRVGCRSILIDWESNQHSVGVGFEVVHNLEELLLLIKTSES